MTVKQMIVVVVLIAIAYFLLYNYPVETLIAGFSIVLLLIGLRLQRSNR